MTPEKRAEAVLDRLGDDASSASMTVADWQTLERLIAQAIRDAEDAALERAAVRCEAEAKRTVGGFCDGLFDAATVCRSLKSKEI